MKLHSKAAATHVKTLTKLKLSFTRGSFLPSPQARQLTSGSRTRSRTRTRSRSKTRSETKFHIWLLSALPRPNPSSSPLDLKLDLGPHLGLDLKLDLGLSFTYDAVSNHLVKSVRKRHQNSDDKQDP